MKTKTFIALMCVFTFAVVALTYVDQRTHHPVTTTVDTLDWKLYHSDGTPRVAKFR